MSDSELRRLRASMARCDRSIQRTVTRRLSIARRIGEAKRAEGLPVRDYAVEKAVLERWRSALEPSDVAPERAEQLARWLVEEAVRVQERLPEADAVHDRPSDVLVVGGAGAMGSWMARFLRAEGHRVAIFDPRASPAAFPEFEVKPDLERSVGEAEVVVVATPMRRAPAVYRAVVDALGSALLFDILSIKAPLREEIRRATTLGRRVTSVHPLFGPSARVLSGRNLLVLDCGDAKAATDAERLFRRSSLTISRRTLDEHDPLMANVLGLPHATSLLFSTVLAAAYPGPGGLTGVGPISFARQAEVARVVTAENPELSFDIQTLNASSLDLIRRMQAALERIRATVEQQDRDAYRALLTESQRMWANPLQSST